ncbi:MAG TPA: hypothetical protein PK910_02150 [Bacteroidales bacterium]|nr:hypothetical protein [Bacteroidales bacterium]HRC88811.1 hypothetical protein [Bacteroidales bacterium]
MDGDEKYPYAMVDKSKGIIVGWEVKPVTEERDRSELWGKWIFRGDMVMLEAMMKDGAGNWSSGAGTGGSMARFMLNENYLYLIAHPWMLKVVNVKQAGKMNVVDSASVSRTMETLFKLENKLFIGTTTGMLIYDISDPESPFQISEYNHIKACDPVVADGHYAYVTLRSGTKCFNTQNLLEVIDISSITAPYLVKSYPMFNPHGPGVDRNMLFVCDGKAGLKIYDKTDPLGIITNQLAHYPDFDTYDVIPVNGILMLIGQFWLTGDDLRCYVENSPVNTDNKPLVEFSKVINIGPVPDVMDFLINHQPNYEDVFLNMGIVEDREKELSLINNYVMAEKHRMKSIVNVTRAYMKHVLK